jgi:hypothetical protein
MYFQNKRYKWNIFQETIFIIFIPKISLLKSLNSKIAQQKHVRIKMIIILILKLNSGDDSGKILGH